MPWGSLVEVLCHTSIHVIFSICCSRNFFTSGSLCFSKKSSISNQMSCNLSSGVFITIKITYWIDFMMAGASLYVGSFPFHFSMNCCLISSSESSCFFILFCQAIHFNIPECILWFHHRRICRFCSYLLVNFWEIICWFFRIFWNFSGSNGSGGWYFFRQFFSPTTITELIISIWKKFHFCKFPSLEPEWKDFWNFFYFVFGKP